MYKIALLTSLVTLGACSAFLDTRPPQEVVRERATEHMELLLAQEFEQALKYTTPGFQSRTTPKQYAGRYGGVWSWQKVWVGEVLCDEVLEPERCTARTYREVRTPHLPYPTEHYRPQTWIKIDGTWFVYEA